MRYAPINYATWVFAAQAAVIAVFALYGPKAQARRTGTSARAIGLTLVAYAVLLHPLAAPLFGRPLAQAEVFGLAPDPTAFAGLGLVLAFVRGTWRAVLSIVPVLWCVVSAATLFTLGAPQAWFPVAALGIWVAGMVYEIVRPQGRD